MDDYICKGCGHKLGANILAQGSCVLCGNPDHPLMEKTNGGAEVPCNVGLSAQLKIATDALNMIGSGTEDSMPPYRSMGASQMKDVAYKALTEINNIDEVSR